MATLKETTAKGLLWGGLNNASLQLIGLAFGIIMGWLLDPSDYGMTAVLLVFNAIAVELQNSGFKTALINKTSPTDNDYNSVFWFNVLVGAAIYALLFFAAPLIARYYHEPALVPLSRYVFLSNVFSCLGVAQSAWLVKNMRFQQIAQSGIVAIIVADVVGIIMALLGCGYWSLASQGVVFVGTNTLQLWYHSKWRPSLHIDFGPVRTMFRFGIKVMLAALFNQLNNQMLNVLLGKYFTKTDVGYYNQAYQWNSKAFGIVRGMGETVAQPVLVDTGGERERQLRVLRKMMRFLSFISFPLLFGLSLVAHEFIGVLLPERWLRSADLLRILAIGGATMPLASLLYNLILSRGRSDIYMWGTVGFAILQVGALVMLKEQGIRAMVVAYVALNVAWLFVWHFFARRLTGYRLRHFLADTLPFAAIAVGVMVATALVTQSIGSLLLLLVSRIVIAAALYYAVLKLLHAQILDECIQFVVQKIRKKGEGR